MKVIVILGPTATGKSKLGIELAKKLNGEVINTDSTQIYKGLDIATAKVNFDEMEGIKHHLLNIKNLEEDYSVYDFQKDARKLIDEILSKGKVPILVGGTGLYIKACLYDYNLNDDVEKKDYGNYTNQQLFEMVEKLNLNEEIHENNRKKNERILDYYYSGKLENRKLKSNNLIYNSVIIGLTTTREILYNKINERVDTMLKNGLLEEAKKLYELPRYKSILTPIGYKELFSYFDNNISLEESVNKIKQNSRRYAKRQYTWFNNQMKVNWFNVDYNNFYNTVKKVLTFINEN